MAFADLHLHTNFSDGTYTPEELAEEAARHDLKAIALTDHDSLDGCPRMFEACRKLGIQFIPASELTAEMNGKELHILGYYLDPGNEKLHGALTKFQQVRQERIEEMAKRLQALGIPMAAKTIFELARCQSPGRPHVARALVREGFCGSLDEAFERYLKQGQPAWVPKFKMSAREAIALIHGAGGVASFAHPGLTRADELIPALVAAGLDALECIHTKHSPTLEKHYLAVAQTHGLLVTGGSDCHGLSKGKPLIGTRKLPYHYVLLLEAKAFRRAADNGLPLAAFGSAEDHGQRSPLT